MAADKTPALKPTVGKHRLAADIMVALVQRYGVMGPTPIDAQLVAKAAYTYAEAFVREGDGRQ